MAVTTFNALPNGGKVVKRDAPTSFGGIRLAAPNPDAGFTKHKTPTSNDSGRTFYRNKSKGKDGHTDVYEYERQVNFTKVDDENKASAGILGSGGGSSYSTNLYGTKEDTSQNYYENISYKKGGRAAGTSAAGDKQPQRAKRAKYVGSDRPSAGGRDNKQAKGSRSTILTGSRGLGNTGAAKTLLGG